MRPVKKERKKERTKEGERERKGEGERKREQEDTLDLTPVLGNIALLVSQYCVELLLFQVPVKIT